MQITFVKNGKRIKHDNAQWEMVAANLTCADVTPYTERKSTQRILLHEASERQAKHPDMEKVTRAIKYLESKKAFQKQWCIGNLVKGDTYGCGLGGSLGPGNSMKLNNIQPIDNSDY